VERIPTSFRIAASVLFTHRTIVRHNKDRCQSGVTKCCEHYFTVG